MSLRKKTNIGGLALPVLLVGVLVLGGAAVWYNISSAPTGHSMIPPDTSAIARGDPIVTVKLPAVLSADAQIGKRVFDAKCSRCHGKNAAGRNGLGPPFIYSFYKPSHHGDMAFVLAAKNGVRAHHWNFGNMPPVKGVTSADVKYVARYIRELQRANGIN